MNQETLNIIMSSPVLVAIVTAAASAVMSKVAQKSNSEQRDRRETERNEDRERISEIHKISKGLDRHINNNEVPFRQQVNEKLDSMTSTVEAPPRPRRKSQPTCTARTSMTGDSTSEKKAAWSSAASSRVNGTTTTASTPLARSAKSRSSRSMSFGAGPGPTPGSLWRR